MRGHLRRRATRGDRGRRARAQCSQSSYALRHGPLWWPRVRRGGGGAHGKHGHRARTDRAIYRPRAAATRGRGGAHGKLRLQRYSFAKGPGRVIGSFDIVVIGGGVMGSSAALQLARGGMRVALCEARQLCSGASGVNAGTLSMQTKRIPLIPYALRGYDLWKRAGDAVGFKETGSLTLAYTEREAEVLITRMSARREVGAPIELSATSAAHAMEPNLGDGVVAASYCAADGYANSSLTGVYYRSQLRLAGVALYELTPVQKIVPDGSEVMVQTRAGALRGTRVLLATGAWAKQMSEQMGTPLPIRVRVNTVSVTERMARLVTRVIAHASGQLTLKQSPNGTVLIGGAWQGRGTPETWHSDIAPETLIANLRLAQHVLPRLAEGRLVR